MIFKQSKSLFSVTAAIAGLVLFLMVTISPISLLAATTQTTQTLSQTSDEENINSSSFRLIVCDGPPLPANVPKPTDLGHTYVPCDFNGIMKQVQHLINIALIVGVLTFIVSLCYMGYLYISGSESNIKKAHEIFPKAFWGFIIMLTAWFIVFQILNWLTGSSGFSALLGS